MKDIEGEFYFALPRLINRLRGRSDEVSEGNAGEAYFGSFGILIVSLAFGLQLLGTRFGGWRGILVFVFLVFAIFVFWMLVFFINSIAIKVLRACGCFSKTAGRHVQDIFIGVVLAAFACGLSTFDSWTRWLGILCLLLIGINVLAALLLTLDRRERR